MQHAAVERAATAHVQLARRPVSVVTDSACDLPDEVIRAHGIHVVPLMVMFENEALRDRVDIDAATFVQRLRGGEQPTTSQPPPKAFMDGFRAAAGDGETVLAVVLSSGLSGTFTSAEAAAKRMDEVPIVLVDSRSASMAQGLLVLRACELAELGRTAHEIADELRRTREQCGLLFTVDVFDNLLRSGRVGRGQVMIAGLLDIRPILGIEADGLVHSLVKVRGRGNVPGRMLDVIAGRLPPRPLQLRFAVVHVGCRDRADEVAALIGRRFDARDIIVTPASPVLATHLGPGAWGVAWHFTTT
jgi:DegV family protein with EDD domain